jgi:Ca2+-binding RTX toxin-like protein
LLGGAGNDVLEGGSGDDMLDGGDGDDVLTGNTGDDRFVASGGSDAVNGGSGFDTIDFSGSSAAVKADLHDHVATGEGSAKLASIEAVVGSTFDDVLIGDKNVNAIDGGVGNDWIRGWGGADTLTGGKGADTFHWGKADELAGGPDTITDFSVADGDVLDLSKLIVGKATAESVGDVVKLEDGKDGTMVMVDVGGRFEAVALLADVHGLSVQDMLAEGHLLT